MTQQQLLGLQQRCSIPKIQPEHIIGHPMRTRPSAASKTWTLFNTQHWLRSLLTKSEYPIVFHDRHAVFHLLFVYLSSFEDIFPPEPYARSPKPDDVLRECRTKTCTRATLQRWRCLPSRRRRSCCNHAHYLCDGSSRRSRGRSTSLF